MTATERRRLIDALGVAPEALPLVALSGSRGKSTVGWMLDAIVRAAGRATGAWLSSGVYVNGALQEGELGPWARVVREGRDGELDVVLQEMSATTVVAAGLPLNSYPLAIVTTLCGNNESCLLTEDTRLQRRALQSVLAAVRPDGLVIANADDYDVVELVERRAGRALMYALRLENPALRRHLERGGVGAWIEDGAIMIGDRVEDRRIMATDDVPATLNGAMLLQEQNALAALAAAWALGLPPAAIRAGLSGFSPDPVRQPGACNIVRYNRGTIVIDAPTQIWSLRMVARGVRHQPRRRSMVVSGCFPALPADELHEAGRILGNLGAIVLVHGEHATPERLHAIKEGLASASYPPVVLAMPDEQSAIEHLLNALGPDDVGLVLADDAPSALAWLWPAPTISIEGRRRIAERTRE